MTFPTISPSLVPTAFDWVFIAFLAVAMPILAQRSLRRFRKRLAEGIPDARVRGYRVAAIEQWIASAVLLTGCWYLHRDRLDLGMVWPTGGQAWLTWGVVAAGVVFLALQMRAVAVSEKARRQAKEQVEDMAEFIPASLRELKYFSALSVTAGINEELVYRGYLMGILWSFGGPVAAVIGSMLVFTIGHLYQAKNLPKIAGVGFIMSMLYLLSGSVFPLMILHAAIDLAAGWISWRVNVQPRSQGSPPGNPGLMSTTPSA